MKPLKVEMWPIEKVVPYENNSKIHDPAQVSGIAKSIQEFGWDQPIVVDAAGVIIKGHGRRLASIKLGLKEVPVLVRHDLTPEQTKAARLADNRVALGGIDTNKLQQELEDIVAAGVDLKGIFTEKEMVFMVNADLGELNPDAFTEDLEGEVRKQAEETEQKINETDKKEIPLAKAFGFKTVPVAVERSIVGFMAKIEERFNLKGAAALAAFLQSPDPLSE